MSDSTDPVQFKWNKPDVTQAWYPGVTIKDLPTNLEKWGVVFYTWKKYADENGYEHGDLKELCYWLDYKFVSASDAYEKCLESK